MGKSKGKRSRQRAPQRVVQLSDIGTPQLKNHFPVVITGEGQRRRAQALDHPLLYYRNRKEITDEQLNAGLCLLSDYEVSHQHKTAFTSMHAQLGVRIAVYVDPENPHTALERFRRAMRVLPRIGQKFASEVCIEGFFVSEVRAQFGGWNKKNNGMDRFREVLDDLLAFYTADKKEAEARSAAERDRQQREYEKTFPPAPSSSAARPAR